jgi:transcriptional regulator with XRE-family HTH domain
MDEPHQFGAFKGMASVNNIRALREARGWSRPDLAKLMGTSPQQVERLEKGTRGLDLGWIDKAAHAFGVAVADIITAGADVKPGAVATIEEIAADHGWALIEEVDLALGMGTTFLDSYTTPESLGIVPFKADWLRGFLGDPSSI